jgi:hypothetical protein
LSLDLVYISYAEPASSCATSLSVVQSIPDDSYSACGCGCSDQVPATSDLAGASPTLQRAGLDFCGCGGSLNHVKMTLIRQIDGIATVSVLLLPDS